MTTRARMAALVAALINQDLLRADDEAKKLNVSSRAIYRDLQALTAVGVGTWTVHGYRLIAKGERGVQAPPRPTNECRDCTNAPVNGRTRCQACLDRGKKYRERRASARRQLASDLRARRKAEHRCQWCGAELMSRNDGSYGALCGTHAARQIEYRRGHRKQDKIKRMRAKVGL